MEKYILALDAGTTSCRALLIDHKSEIAAVAQREFRQYYPAPGWVEHDAEEIYDVQMQVAREVIAKGKITSDQIAAIGITNQRETIVVWDRDTGKPVHRAIVWQDRRTSRKCNDLKVNGLEAVIKSKTGLVIDAYFSASKIQWILEQVPGVGKIASKGRLAVGTIDSWLVWKMTEGETHITDVTNASRTMVYNIHDLRWDSDLLDLFDIPKAILPEVKSSSEIFGYAKSNILGAEIPIAGIAGDQQAALFGQLCLKEGMVKNTYGTGCFVMMNTGTAPKVSDHQLLTTIAWQLGDTTTYALEGSVFIAGALVQWLRDELGIIEAASDIEALAASVPDNGDVYIVPAFAGLGAPYWDQYARGLIIGLTRGTGKAHLARAAIESIAFQTYDVIQSMVLDSGISPRELRADGGASVNDLLLQIQADLIGFDVSRPKITETTAMGAAYLAGLATGYWTDIDDLSVTWKSEKLFKPEWSSVQVERALHKWRKALERSRGWVEE